MGTVVNVVVGTIFVFLVFSLVVSGVNELLAGVFAIRSKILWQTLEGLAGPTDAAFPRLTLRRVLQLPFTARWLEHLPLVGRVFRGWRDHRPTVPEDATGAGFVERVAARTARFDSTNPSRPTRVKRVSPQVISQVLIELGGELPTLADEAGHLARQGQEFLDGVRERVAGTNLERPVRVAIARAQGDIDQFRVAMEEWFDARMEALTSLYKTWARWILLGVALVVAFVMNVNPVRTVDALRKDTALAQITADQAREFVADVGGTDVCQPASSSAQQPEVARGPDAASDQVAKCYAAIEDAVARGRQLPPPLNFDHVFWGTEGWWQYLLGSLLGAVAISFGAPFWFDALRKLTSLRR